MPKIRSVLVVAAVAAVGSFAAVWLFVKHVVEAAEYYQGTLGPAIEAKYGFTHGSPYVLAGNFSQEVFTLRPTSGGVLAQHGVVYDDIVLGYSITELYRDLYECRNSPITITLVVGDDGPPLEARARRLVHIPCAPLSIRPN